MKNFGFQSFLRLFSVSNQLSTKVGNKSTNLTVQEFERLAEVVETISPHQRGRVRYHGSYWYAVSQQDVCILPKTRVLVLGRESLTLLVKPLSVITKNNAQENIGGQMSHLQIVG